MMYLIEPHSDDVFLSLHTHITKFWLGRKMTIVTVFCDMIRAREAASYAEVVKCEHIALGYEESGAMSSEAKVLPSFRDWGIDKKASDIFIFPCGLQHPEHIAVRKGVTTRRLQTLYYLDTPYYAKQKLGNELNSLVKGMELHSMAYASAFKWKHIPLFKSQSKYFFNHPPESLPRLEIVLKEKP